MISNDYQRVRFLAPEERLRLGDLTGALSVPDDGLLDPGALFTRALATIRAKQSPERIGTALLHAFAANRYVTPILLGEPWTRLDGHHGCNWAEPDYAAEYVESAMDIWRSEPTAAATVRFWWKAGPVATWRGELDACVVALGKLRPGDERSAMVTKRHQLADRTRSARSWAWSPGRRRAPSKAGCYHLCEPLRAMPAGTVRGRR